MSSPSAVCLLRLTEGGFGLAAEVLAVLGRDVLRFRSNLKGKFISLLTTVGSSRAAMMSMEDCRSCTGGGGSGEDERDSSSSLLLSSYTSVLSEPYSTCVQDLGFTRSTASISGFGGSLAKPFRNSACKIREPAGMPLNFLTADSATRRWLNSMSAILFAGQRRTTLLSNHVQQVFGVGGQTYTEDRNPLEISKFETVS